MDVLRSVTGLSDEQLGQYNLRLFCERCLGIRKQKSRRIGYLILLTLFLLLVIMWIL